jgi:carbonic anhydrase
MLIHNVLILLLILGCKCADVHWDYSEYGPDVWRELVPACGGQKQSPINIKTKCTNQQSYDSFRLSDNHDQSLNFKLKNNGHTIVANTTSSLSFTGGGLDGRFYFDSFHLHWGPNHNSGSEHQM